MLDLLAKKGVPYAKVDGPAGAAPRVSIGVKRYDGSDAKAIEAGLQAVGYTVAKVKPGLGPSLLILLCLVTLGMAVGLSYGPIAAYLVELFPARVRYTSLSLPYHVANGYVGGFVPFIGQLIVVQTGDPFAGLWYPVCVCAIALVVLLFFVPETAGKALD